jgi:hypothetical protein
MLFSLKTVRNAGALNVGQAGHLMQLRGSRERERENVCARARVCTDKTWAGTAHISVAADRLATERRVPKTNRSNTDLDYTAVQL